MADSNIETWETPWRKYTTKEAWLHVREEAGIKVSRATVYHFLDEMANKGLIGYETSTGRGGERILFYSEYSEDDFRELAAEKLIECVKQSLLSHRDVDEA
jgi:predicted transcriptional regulator